MTKTTQHKALILETLRQKFPSWNGFDNPDLVAEEITYKRATVEKAQKLLAEETLRTLLGQEDYEEFLQRLKTVDTGPNLLNRSTPSSGDLNILLREDLHKATFADALFDLLWGEDNSRAFGPLRSICDDTRSSQQMDLSDVLSFPLPSRF